MLTAKSLICISLILAFAMALQDGDKIAFKMSGSHDNAPDQYLNGNTIDGSVSLAKNTDFATSSGTWWRAHFLSDGSWAFENLGNISYNRHIYLNGNTETGAVNLVESTEYSNWKTSGTHWGVEHLADGTIALEYLGGIPVSMFTFLGVDTNTGAVKMAGSNTHWEIVTLVPAASSAPPV